MLLEAQTHSKQNKCSLGARINRNRVSKLERVLSRDGISTVALRFPRWLLQQKTHFVFLSKTRKFSLDFSSWSIISLYERCGRRGNSCCCSANRLVFHTQNVFFVVITLFYFSRTSKLCTGINGLPHSFFSAKIRVFGVRQCFWVF